MLITMHMVTLIVLIIIVNFKILKMYLRWKKYFI
jgi:hypothetical protein